MSDSPPVGGCAEGDVVQDPTCGNPAPSTVAPTPTSDVPWTGEPSATGEETFTTVEPPSEDPFATTTTATSEDPFATTNASEDEDSFTATTTIYTAAEDTFTTSIGGETSATSTPTPDPPNNAVSLLKKWIPIVGITVGALIIITVVGCLLYQRLRRRRRTLRQMRRSAIVSLEGGAFMVDDDAPAVPVRSEMIRLSNDNGTTPLAAQHAIDDYSEPSTGRSSPTGVITTTRYNGHEIPPMGARIIPPQQQIRYGVGQGLLDSPRHAHYASRTLFFHEV